MQVSVRNPIPGLQTVAIAPFFNLSAERAVDGRGFANAYYAELQKVPGFEVIPIGVVEQALREHSIEMQGPADAIRLAEILKVDAVVIGAVTDYDPYVPRVGLKIAWYSPKQWQFLPKEPPSKCKPKLVGHNHLPAQMPSRFAASRWKPALVTTQQAARDKSRTATVRAQSADESEFFTTVDEIHWQVVPDAGEVQPSSVIVDDPFLPPVSGVVEELATPHSVEHLSTVTRVSTQPVTWIVPPLPEDVDEPGFVGGPLFTVQRPTLSSPPLNVVVPIGTLVPLPLPPEPPDAFREPFVLELTGHNAVAGSDPADPLRVIESLDQAEEEQLLAQAAAAEPQLVDRPADARPVPIARGEPGILVDEQGSKPKGDVPPPLVVPDDSEPFFERSGPARARPLNSVPISEEPLLPLMSHIRLFDAGDSELLSRLNDYLEVSGEVRTGDVQAFMRRSDFFQKFTAYVMVTDMLSEHGGEARRRWVLKHRSYR